MKRLPGKPGARKPPSKPIPRVRGHVGELKRRQASDAAQRVNAANILTPDMVRGGDWNAAKGLLTTLGGKARELTREDLATFRQNMRALQGRIPAGITARQVLDMAEGRPLPYARGKPEGADLAKARSQIHYAHPVSATIPKPDALDVRFITPSGGETSGVNSHTTTIRFFGYGRALARIAATPDDAKTAKKEGALSVAQAVRLLRTGHLAMDCTCGRWTYFFRYVATIGGFAAGRQETGFPKIRNPGLAGVACKHLLRTVREVESSNAVARMLEQVLRKAQGGKRPNVTAKQADLAATARKRASTIQTTADRAADRERRAIRKAASRPATPSPRITLSAAKRRALASIAKQLGLSPDEAIRRLLA